MSAKVFKFPVGMAFDLRRAATCSNVDADAPDFCYGYGMFGRSTGLPHDVYQRDLAHGIDHNQLVNEAVAEFASGAFTLH